MTEDSENKNRVYFEGFEANVAGKKASDCPYPSSTPWHRHWHDGYAGASRIDEVYSNGPDPVEEPTVELEQNEIIDEFYLLTAMTRQGHRVYWHYSTAPQYVQGWFNSSISAAHYHAPDITLFTVQSAFEGSHRSAKDLEIIQNSVRFVKCQLLMAIGIEDMMETIPNGKAVYAM